MTGHTGAVVLEIASGADLSGIRAAHLQAVADGAVRLEVVLAPGIHAAAGPSGAGALQLGAVTATGAPPTDVVLRSADPSRPAVLVGLPVAVPGRAVTLEGLVLVSSPIPAVSITVTGTVTMRRVTVLGPLAGHRPHPVIEVTTADPSGGSALLDEVTVLASHTADALISLGASSGAWWGSIELDGLVVADCDATAAVQVGAVLRLVVRDTATDADGVRSILRFGLPPFDGRVERSVLAGPADSAVVVDAVPPRPPAPIGFEHVVLGGGPSGLGPHVRPGEGTGEDPRAALRVREVVRDRARSLLGLDAALDRQLMPFVG